MLFKLQLVGNEIKWTRFFFFFCCWYDGLVNNERVVFLNWTNPVGCLWSTLSSSLTTQTAWWNHLTHVVTFVSVEHGALNAHKEHQPVTWTLPASPVSSPRKLNLLHGCSHLKVFRQASKCWVSIEIVSCAINATCKLLWAVIPLLLTPGRCLINGFYEGKVIGIKRAPDKRWHLYRLINIFKL